MPPNKDEQHLISAGGAMRLIKRPDKGGKAGRPIELQANHFRFSINTSLVVHQYDVEVARFAYDGKPKRNTK